MTDFEPWVNGVENGNHTFCHSRMYREQVPSKARYDERTEVDGGFATVAIFDSAMHSACAKSFKHVVASRKVVGLVEGLVIHHAVLQARY